MSHSNKTQAYFLWNLLLLSFIFFEICIRLAQLHTRTHIHISIHTLLKSSSMKIQQIANIDMLFRPHNQTTQPPNSYRRIWNRSINFNCLNASFWLLFFLALPAKRGLLLLLLVVIIYLLLLLDDRVAQLDCQYIFLRRNKYDLHDIVLIAINFVRFSCLLLTLFQR